MTNITKFDPRERSLDHVLGKMCEHQDQIANIVACITWDDGSSQIVYNQQTNSELAYAMALMQAELIPLMNYHDEENT